MPRTALAIRRRQLRGSDGKHGAASDDYKRERAAPAEKHECPRAVLRSNPDGEPKGLECEQPPVDSGGVAATVAATRQSLNPA